MTRNRVGWVLVEGHDADGATLDHDEFTVGKSGGVRAVETAERATAAVLQTQAVVDARGERLHAVGVTWNDDAAADAALLLEFLTDAGLDNVVPVRFLRAAEALAHGIGPVIGSQHTAVCLIEDDCATVVMVSDNADGAQAAVNRATDDESLIRWLTTIFDRKPWRPEGLVIAGSGNATPLDETAARLEHALGMTVIAHAGAQLTLARGAALASAPSAEFTAPHLAAASSEPVVSARGPRRLAYAGGVTMLVAGAVSFVVSLSLAVGLRLAPDHGPIQQITNTSTTQPIAEAAPAPSSP